MQLSKGKKKRHKHKQVSQPTWLQKLIAESIAKVFVQVATSVLLLLAAKYLG